MSDGTKWLVLSMLISLSAGNVCRNSGNCSCQWISIWEWEIQCPSHSNPKFNFHVDGVRGRWKVECYDVTSWSEFEYQSTFPLFFSWSIQIRIKRCPLPDKPFGHLIKRFGLKWMDSLTFTSHMNLSSTLTQQHLSMLYDLWRLFLSSNGLTELPSDLFREVDQLRLLDLSFNKIAILPHDIFRGLSRIRKIDLSYNAMKFVDWRLFGNCTRLNELSLRGNLLTSLDYWQFRDLIYLKGINLAENLLETLPLDVFEYPEELQLDMSGNRFSMLPERLFARTELRNITVCDNSGNLTTLPKNFLNNLTRLETVILIRNNLTYLPENILWGSFSVLTIDLHGNALSTLPENIFRDSSTLTYLDLSDNHLTYVPEGLFRALTKLLDLNLKGNGITSLSANIFGNLNSLLDLNLGFNNITVIHSATFLAVANMQLIRLSHNSLGLGTHSIADLSHWFHGRSIQKIFLDHNNFIGHFGIHSPYDRAGENLRLVDLSNNQIHSLWVRSPSTGSVDVEYDLRHNNIHRFILEGDFSSKMSILVDDNPIYCGCEIYAPLKYAHEIRAPQSGENLQIILGNASCSGPDWIKGTPVASLRLETFTCRPNLDDRYVRCPESCDCWCRPHDKTRIVDCSSRNFGKMPEKIIGLALSIDRITSFKLGTRVYGNTNLFDWLKQRVELDFANNSLTDIPTLDGTGYEYVERLILSHNNILKLSFDVLPPRLETLDLDHNDLKNFDRMALNAIINSTTLKKLNIEGNPLSCDSDTRRALDFMKKKLGPNLRYSVQTCLDFRNPPNTEKAPATYISYTIF